MHILKNSRIPLRREIFLQQGIKSPTTNKDIIFIKASPSNNTMKMLSNLQNRGQVFRKYERLLQINKNRTATQ